MKTDVCLPVLLLASYLFLYVPLMVLILFSFNGGRFPAPWVGFSLEWYRELFTTPEVWHAFVHSLIVAVELLPV